MKDEDKTKEQLINELKQLRQRAAEWEKSETELKQLQEALQESEQWHRLLVETMSDGLAVMDKNMLIMFVNDKFCEMLGYNRQELIGRPGIDLHDEANQIILKEELAKRRQGKHGPYEITFSRKDGQRVSALVSPRPLLDAEGHFKGSFAVVTDITELKHKEAELAKHRQHLEKLVEERTAQLTRANKQLQRDITERKRTEEALRESEKRFRQVAESIREVFYLNDPDKTQMIYVSPAYEEIWGRTCDSLYERPMSFLEAVHPEDRERVLTTFEKQRRGEPIEVEYRIVRPDGSSRWIWSRAFPVSDERGKLDRIAGIAEDITERKKAEEALKESEEKFRNLAEQSPSMIFINKKGRMVYVNEKGEEITGYTREQLCSADFDFLTLIAPGSQQLVQASFSKHMKGKEVGPYEHTLITKEGKRFEVLVITKLISYEGETAILGTSTDITERKEVEEALRRRETELELQAIKLEEANTALRFLLKQREDDRAELEERILSNVKQLVVPSIERLKTTRLDAKQMTYVGILESHIDDVISPFAHKLSSAYYNLTFKEIQVASLVREGKTNKEIAELLNISTRTAGFHRESLRKKLGLRNKKINLRSHLLSLS